MGMMAMIGTAILAAGSAVLSSEQKRMQQIAQGEALENQANLTRQQNDLIKARGDLEARNIDKQKSKLRREFEAMQGHNRSLLAAGNVDMTSGSALDVSTGNIDHFAAEIGENAYAAALKRWETQEQVKANNYQADIYQAQGSYLQDSAGSLGLSLLKGAIAGGTAFASMYGAGMAGGAMGSGTAGATGAGTSTVSMSGVDANGLANSYTSTTTPGLFGTSFGATRKQFWSQQLPV